MADNQLRERINAAVGRSQNIGRQIEAYIAQGVKPTDTRVTSLMSQRETALDEAETFKRALEGQDRAGLLDAWRNQPAAGIVPNGLGRMDDDYSGRELSALDRHTATPEYRSALNKLVRAATQTKGDPIALLSEVERNTLTIGSDGAGGYTVPADTRNVILARTAAISRIMALCTMAPTSRDFLEWPRVTPNGTSESIFTSGFVGSMVGEQPSTTAGQNEPSFGMFAIPMKNARVQARLSFNLVADADADILAFLASDGARNLALVREQQILVGTGIGANVKGLINYSGDGTDGTIATTDISGTTADQISNTTADAGSAPKILDLIYSVPAQYRNDPSFAICMTSDSYKKIRKLIDVNGSPMLATGGDGLLAPAPRSIDGYPVVISEFLENGGTNGNRVVVAGAFSEEIIGVRQELSVAVYQERFADLDQVAIFLRSRFGAAPANNDAFRIGVV